MASPYDAFGFPSHQLTAKQASRFATRQWTQASQWSAKFGSLAAVAAAPRESVATLVLSHGICQELRPDLWLAACAPGVVASSDYAALVAASPSIDDAVGRQIELDLPRTFSDQRDFAASVALSYRDFDGSRSGLAEALEAVAPSRATEGSIHDALRRMLRCVFVPLTI